MIATFGVFAGGYLMRPLGAVLLGHIGDRVSRKAALIVSVSLMTISTTAIALLPTYAVIGIGAPVLLTMLRLLQGLSVGGEYTGAVVLLGEAAPGNRRALFCSIVVASGVVGVLAASGAATIGSYALSTEAFDDWGWRLLYAPAPLVGVIGFLLRRGLVESAAINRPRSLPIVTTVKEHGRALLQVAGITAAAAIGNYMIFVYGPTYLTRDAGLPRSEALAITTVGNAALIVTIIAFAWLADRIGRRPVMLFGSIGLLLLPYPLFSLLRSGDLGLMIASQIAFAVLIGAIGGGLSAVMVELFPKAIRYTGTSLAYSIPLGILGGTTPLVATTLIDVTGSDISPVFYLMVAAAVCVVTVTLTPETKGRRLD